MNVGNSVRKGIEDWELKDNERFATFLRDHYAIHGPMGILGFNLTVDRYALVIVSSLP